MKKYYCITILALIVITLLQGYNISLQYREYIHNETDKVNAALKTAIDEEYAIRAHKKEKSNKDGKQRVFYKIMKTSKKQIQRKKTLFDLTKSTFKI